MLQLGTKCFNAQGSNYSSCTCRSSEKYVAAVEAHNKNERRMKLSLPPKLMVF